MNKYKEWSKKYYTENKDRIKEYGKIWRKENPEYNKEYSKIYNEEYNKKCPKCLKPIRKNIITIESSEGKTYYHHCGAIIKNI